MSCDVSAERLSAFVDGETDAGERGDVERHLADCAECAARVRTVRSVKHAVGRLASKEPIHDAARARIETSLSVARVRASRRRRATIGIAGTITLAAAFALGWVLRPEPPSYADDLIEDYARSVPAELPGEVVSDDRDAVRAFFDGRVAFEPLVPELPGARLLGGRVCIIRGRATQLLFYQRAQTTLALFVVDHPDAAGQGCVERDGQAVCCRHEHDRRLMLVGPLPPSELDRIVHQAAL